MVTRRFCAIALVLVLGLFVLGSYGFGLFSEAKRSFAADVNANESATDIAKQEMALARDALNLIAEYEKNVRATAGSNEAVIWSRRLVEAARKSGATKAEIIWTIKQHQARMSSRVALLRSYVQAGQATPIELLNGQYEALEAKAWLEEVEGK